MCFVLGNPKNLTPKACGSFQNGWLYSCTELCSPCTSTVTLTTSDCGIEYLMIEYSHDYVQTGTIAVTTHYLTAASSEALDQAWGKVL